MSAAHPRPLIEEARKLHGFLEAEAQRQEPRGTGVTLRRLDALLLELADALEARLPPATSVFREGMDVEVIGNSWGGSDAFIGQRGFVAADGPDRDGDVTITMYRDQSLDVTFPATSLELL